MHVLVDKLLLHGEHLNLTLLASCLFALRCLSFIGLFLLRCLGRLFDDLFGICDLRLNDIVRGIVLSQATSEAAEVKVEGCVKANLHEVLCVRKFKKFIATTFS